MNILYLYFVYFTLPPGSDELKLLSLDTSKHLRRTRNQTHNVREGFTLFCFVFQRNVLRNHHHVHVNTAAYITFSQLIKLIDCTSACDNIWPGGVQIICDKHPCVCVCVCRLRVMNRYPCFRWNSYPRYIHVVVQQVEFGLQRQDEAVGRHKGTLARCSVMTSHTICVCGLFYT